MTDGRFGFMRNLPRSMQQDGPWKCDECGVTVGKHRARHVIGFERRGSAHSASQNAHVFCPDCHPRVFAEANWEKYPSLFSRVARWKEGMDEWQQPQVMARLFGLRNAKSFSNLVRYEGEVMGWEVERKTEHRRILYRVVGLV